MSGRLYVKSRRWVRCVGVLLLLLLICLRCVVERRGIRR
jgi:hypothetical protein